MRVPVGAKYTATVTGSDWKPVHCEHCACDFDYLVSDRAVGTGVSPLWLDNRGASERAYYYADSDLKRRLRGLKGIASCPECGLFQASMVTGLRREATRDSATLLSWFGLGLAFAGFLVFAMLRSAPTGLRWAASIVVVVFGGRHILKSLGRDWRFNPNSHPGGCGSNLCETRLQVESTQ